LGGDLLEGGRREAPRRSHERSGLALDPAVRAHEVDHGPYTPLAIRRSRREAVSVVRRGLRAPVSGGQRCPDRRRFLQRFHARAGLYDRPVSGAAARGSPRGLRTRFRGCPPSLLGLLHHDPEALGPVLAQRPLDEPVPLRDGTQPLPFPEGGVDLLGLGLGADDAARGANLLGHRVSPVRRPCRSSSSRSSAWSSSPWSAIRSSPSSSAAETAPTTR